MNKKIYSIGLAALSIMGLFSCQLQDDLWGKKSETEQVGVLQLQVEATAPASLSTKADESSNAVNTSDFEVKVQGKADTDVKDVLRSYPRVSELPKEITLPVGDYIVSSHTKGELQRQMDAPYYAGEKDMKIAEGTTQQATVKCTMKNSRIQMAYSTEFLNAFSKWSITITDQSNQAINFTEKETAPQPVYWYFEKETPSIKVHITATTKEGNTVSSEQVFSKSDASETYPDVESNFFTGGDALIITMQPTKDTDGKVKIGISVSIIFANYTEQVKIDVSDKEPETPTTPETPVTPSTGSLSMTLPTDFTMKSDMSDAPKSANAVIEAKAGIKSMIVKIIPGGKGFREPLQDLEKRPDADGGPIRFLTGEELVDNTAVEKLFSDLTLELKAPKKGETSYTFPIHYFFTFMEGMTGAHQFQITLTDNTNKSEQKTLTITITD